MKKVSIVLLAVFMVIGILVQYETNDIQATNFEGEEEKWTSICSQYTTDQSIIATCNEYKEYLNDKTAQKQQESANAQDEIDAVEGDLAKLGDLVYQYQQDVEAVEIEIATVSESIVNMEANIVEVDAKISKQQAKVNERKQAVKDRMIDIQSSINTNEYINFIMGAKNLVDFIQRSESVGTITDYDNQQMDLLAQEIEKLDTDKAELKRIQETIEAQKSVLASQKTELEAKKKESETASAALEIQKNEFVATRDAASDEASAVASCMPSAPVAPPTTDTGNPNGGGSLNWNRDWYSMYYSSPYNIISNVNLTGQCTWYCFGRASEVNGSYLRNLLPTGNAANWYAQAAAKGLAVGQAPQTNAIIVWGFGQYGHVAFVESYTNGVITISEGNVNVPGGGLGYGTSLETAIQYTLTSTLSYDSLVSQRGAPVGFIYF
ncbi:MAG: coiled-coil domain-containing protein [Draconibacterium sp.]